MNRSLRNPIMPALIIRAGITVLLMVVTLAACKNRYNRSVTVPVVQAPLNDTGAIYRANRNMIRENANAISREAAVRGWKLKETGTGLYYEVFPGRKNAHDRKIRPGDLVTLKYRLQLLDGTECASSDDNGPKTFVVDHSDAPSGLHEAVKYMCPGDSAVVVLPPHLAFGLIGDGDKVPSQAVVVYRIRVVSVQPRGAE
jgi:FKBP-type peptidyl-prolyl cis-trans isomerase